MHGRPRQAPSAATPEEVAKIQQYNKHKTAALVAYKNRIFTPTTLALTSSILALNPDLNTLYNYRKEQVIDLIFKKESSLKDIFKTELELSTTSLKKNPKSYHAWYHRIWCLEHGKGFVDVRGELALTEKFFQTDARNFHCWNYRRYLARTLMGLPSPYAQSNKSPAEIQNEKDVITSIAKKYIEKEQQEQKEQKEQTTTTENEQTLNLPDSLDHIITEPIKTGSVSIEKELLFTQKWIENDFSNYSAWHYRSLLLPTVIMRKFTQLPLFKGLYNDEVTFESFFGLQRSKLPPPSVAALDKIIALSTTIHTAVAQLEHLGLLDYQTRVDSLISFSKLLLEYFVAIITLYIELDLSYINIAIIMLPTDQSPWLYQRWVLSLTQQLLSGFKINSPPFFTLQQSNDITSVTVTPTTSDHNNSEQLQNTITDFISTTFIPNSDHNLHYTDLITNFTDDQSSSGDSISSPKLIQLLFNGLQCMMVQDISESLDSCTDNGNGIGIKLPTPQGFFNTITKHTQTPLQNESPYTIDSVIATGQKMTISTLLSSTTSLLEQVLMIGKRANKHSIEPKILHSTLIQQLQTLQVQIFARQYLFLTQELLPLLDCQIGSQRQALLGIVILRLSIGSALLSHKQFKHLTTLLQPSDTLYIQHTTALTLLKKHLSHPVTQGENEKDHAVNIIKLLIALDSDREGYYRELGQLLTQVDISLD